MQPTAKFIIVGSSTVGKTSLVNRLAENEYNINEKATLGVDFKIRTFYTSMQQSPIKIHIWDTAGQERFAQLVSSYYRGSNVILFTFDISNAKSFADLSSRWLHQAGWVKSEETGLFPQNVFAYLIGNKMDTLQRQVKKEDALRFAEANQLKAYMEVSAATGEGVSEHFQTIVDDVYELLRGGEGFEDMDEQRVEFDLPNSVSVVKDVTRHQKNCC